MKINRRHLLLFNSWKFLSSRHRAEWNRRRGPSSAAMRLFVACFERIGRRPSERWNDLTVARARTAEFSWRSLRGARRSWKFWENFSWSGELPWRFLKLTLEASFVPDCRRAACFLSATTTSPYPTRRPRLERLSSDDSASYGPAASSPAATLQKWTAKRGKSAHLSKPARQALRTVPAVSASSARSVEFEMYVESSWGTASDPMACKAGSFRNFC